MRSIVLSLAILAAACSGGGTASTTISEATLPETTDSQATTTTEDGDLGYRWVTGDCVLIDDLEDLPYEPYGSETVVDCSDPHAYEVYFTGTFPEERDTPFPEDLGDRVRGICATSFEEFIGLHLSESALDVIFYLPDRDEWSRGLRYHACVVFTPTGDDVPSSRGTLRDTAERLDLSPGRCVDGVAAKAPTVDCATAHRGEVIGSFTHPGGAESRYPGFEGIRVAADTSCAALLGTYVADPRPGQVVAPFSTGSSLTEVEWDAGLRTVACVAVVIDSARTPLPVVGSLAIDGWWVLTGGITA
jgi:hypothetical protein